ncbi:MAG TPA: YqaJ viral recombinase family protein, partial [Acidimicrobiales bacterium]|nr:YqaJ viral recombinase family protein [Acidimicrobiales bacterium]
MSAAEQIVAPDPERFTVPLPPAHTEAWYAMREPYLGASDVACLFGADPYRSIESLIAEKRTGDRGDETRKMALGKRMEEAIASCFAEDEKIMLAMPEVAYGRGRLLANPDRLIVGSTSDHVEVKRMVGKVVDRPTSGHWMQAQAQMACVGTERCWLVVEDAEDIKSFPIPRDDVFIAEIDLAVANFWEMLDDGLDPVAVRRNAREERLQ